MTAELVSQWEIYSLIYILTTSSSLLYLSSYLTLHIKCRHGPKQSKMVFSSDFIPAFKYNPASWMVHDVIVSLNTSFLIFETWEQRVFMVYTNFNYRFKTVSYCFTKSYNKIIIGMLVQFKCG